ncbi:membrane hypothetical protein [Vibrio chagasii]|nr:membrane hypothetical protein [Vibrio chagasii]
MFQTIIFVILLTAIGIPLFFAFEKGSNKARALCVIIGVVLVMLVVVSLSLTSYWQFNYASDLIQQRGSTYNFVTQMLFDLDSDGLRALVSYSSKYLLVFSVIAALLSMVMYLDDEGSYSGKALTSVGCAIALCGFMAIVLIIPITSPSKISVYKLEAEVSESVIKHYRQICPSNSSVSINAHIYAGSYRFTSKCGSSAGLSLFSYTESFNSMDLDVNDSASAFALLLMNKFKNDSGRWGGDGTRHEVMLKGESRLVLVMKSEFAPPEHDLEFHNDLGRLVSENLTTFVEQQYTVPSVQGDDHSAKWKQVQLL